MKSRRILSAFLAVSLLLLLFTGCAKTPDRTEESEPVEGPGLDDLKATDSLVIYTYTGADVLDQRRINQFIAIYGVDVEVVRVDGKIPEYTERVMNDLASGSGPDVLFVDDLYSADIAKIALNGSLLDLTNVLAEDPDFSEEDYVEGAFEAGQFHGRQYVIPLAFEAPVLLSSTEKLDELGFDWDGIETTEDFVENLGLLTPAAEETPGFERMLDSQNRFSQLLITSGITLIDYETGEVLPEEEELREFLEGYKAYFPYDYNETGSTYLVGMGHEGLLSDKWSFWLAPTVSCLTESISILKNASCDYTMHLIPSQTGETVANIRGGAMAIRANTENSLNAYNFIKFMLSADAQSDQFILPGYMPIRKESIQKIIYNAPSMYQNNGYYFYDSENPALTDEEAEMLIEMFTGIDRFVLGLPVMSTMVQESMLPYFQDEASYEDCFADLKNKLTLYLSE